MFLKLISLEWKSFIRSASFKTNLILKIVLGLIGLYFIFIFSALGFFIVDIIQEMNLDVFSTINRYILYYLFFDLAIRFLFQKLPTTQIRPLLTFPISNKQIVGYTLLKSFNSFFMWIHLFLLLPLSVRLIIEGYPPSMIFLWAISIFGFLLSNNLLNLLLQNKKSILFIIISIAGITFIIHYFTDWDYLKYFEVFFISFYNNSWMFLLPITIVLGLTYFAFRDYLNNLYLDAGIAIPTKRSKNWDWIEGMSTKDPFLQNDIRLILRNKRSKGTLFLSVLFLFYGLLFFKEIDVFDISKASSILIFSIIVSGGFIFSFGQYVPSWDSAYYPLLMSQNIKYRSYLESKWRILLVGGLITGMLSLLYILLDIQLIYPLIAAIAYNIGINTHLALFTGAYIRTPIDLSQNKNIFGDRKAFNVQTMLISLPMFLLPMIIFITAAILGSPKLGYYIIIGTGIIGFVFKNMFFDKIEKIYKKYKYVTLDAYKQKN